MRVYLHYDAADPKFVIKVKLPKKWIAGPTDNLKTTLVDSYNSKHPEHALDGGEFHLELKDGVVLCSDELVSKRIPDRADIFLVPGASVSSEEQAAAAKAKADAAKPKNDPNNPLLTCRRFGCQKKYRESENHDTFCRHHVKPPVFHETAKYWSCCPDKKAYDWETFMAIPGCSVGRCSTEPPGKSVLGGTDVRAASQQQLDCAPKRIDGGGSAAAKGKVVLDKGRVISPLDKLSALRKAMVGVGVDGSQFDSARDSLKERHESLGSEVWKQVCDDLAKAMTKLLEEVEMGKEVA
eukprot:g3394.t1